VASTGIVAVIAHRSQRHRGGRCGDVGRRAGEARFACAGQSGSGSGVTGPGVLMSSMSVFSLIEPPPNGKAVMFGV
jgi:hypothetical protein